MSERLAGLDTRSKVLGGVLLLAVLGLLLRLLLAGGTEEPVLAQPVSAPAGAGQQAPLVDGLPSEPAAPAAQPGAVKDPFRALHLPVTGGAPDAAPAGVPQLPVPAPPADQPADPVPVADLPVGPVPVLDLPEVPVSGPAAPGPGGVPPSAEPVPAVVLVLRSVEGEGAETTATFTVDDATHTATVGEGFAGLTLRALQQGPRPGQWTAVVQPDGGDPFDLVTGAPHRL